MLRLKDSFYSTRSPCTFDYTLQLLLESWARLGSPFFWQREYPPLAVGTYTTSGNSLLAVGMPCAFYSQHGEFHQAYGHDTNVCRELENQIKEAIKSGKLGHLVKGIRKGKAKQIDTQLREWAAPLVKAEPATERKDEHILMIRVVTNPLRRKKPLRIMSIEEMIFPPIRNRAPWWTQFL
nr:hypothetical protein [Tanacetum cinerariifolium]